MKPAPLLGAAALVAFAIVRRHKVTRLDAVVGAIVVAALALYGTGAVHPPDLKDTIADIGDALGPYTYVLVGVAAFLETGAFVGLIAPGETIVLVGGVVAGQGQIQIGWLIPLVWACAVAGDTASFLLGRKLGREFMVKHGGRVKITEERLVQVEGFFERHGGKTILIGRFIGLVRAIAPFIAGASRMPYRRFAPYDILGAGLWGSTFCLLGYVFWQSFDQVANYAGKGALALGTVICVVVGVIAARRWLREPGNEDKARAWLRVQAERPLVRPIVRVVRPIVFSLALPVLHRAKRPAQFTWARLTPGDLGLELTTLIAISAVSVYSLVALAVTISPGDPYALGDLRAFRWAGEIRTSALDDAVKTATHAGTGYVTGGIVTLTVVFLAARRHAIPAAVLVSGFVITHVLVRVIKAAEDRHRPSASLVDTALSSFPSGHAANSVALVAVAVALSRAVPWIAARVGIVTIALAVAIAIGLTRVYLRAHYLSDVVAGWALGAAVFSLCAIAGLVVASVRHNSAR